MPPDLLPAFAAVVLTGGTGERLGGVDKAGVVLDGRTLLDHALAATGDAAAVVVCGPPAPVPPGVRVVRERPPGSGPAAGLLAARDTVTQPWLVVWAVDMPRVGAATVRRLLAAAAHGADGADGSVLVDAEGRRHLCLTVSVARLDDVRPPDASGLGLFRLLADLELVPVPAVGDEARDVDTWEDLAALRRAAEGQDEPKV